MVPASEPEFGITITKDLMVRMRDGVRLATDVYRPAREGEPIGGRLPTLLARTSYDKAAQRYVNAIPDFFVPRGYAVVLQDLRGRYRSEGFGQYFHTANVHEGEDGYDTIEWIAAQPWSNRKVGMLGSSHVAIVQTHAALYRPPHLAAIWPDVGPINSYAHQVRMGGAMQLHMFGALFLHAQDSQEAQADPLIRTRLFEAMEHMRDLVWQTPFKPGLTALSAVPALEETLFNYYTRGSYDEYWQAEFNAFSEYFARHADVPGTYSGGWFDPFADAATTYFATMARQNTAPQRLIVGPWTHMGMRSGLSWENDVDFGSDAAWGIKRLNTEQLRWFDRWLKHVPNGVESEPPVRLFIMGGGSGQRDARGHLDHGGRWRQEHAWPLTRTQFTPYYLSAGGRLLPRPPDATEASAGYAYDPRHPVPTLGGAVTGFNEAVRFPDLDPFWAQYLPPWVRLRSIVAAGPMDQTERPDVVGARPPYRPLAERADVLVFQTEPLAQAIEVTGPSVVRLWIASSAPDTDFTAKLLDVYPPNPDYPAGYAMNLVDGILRARYHAGFAQEHLLEPDVVYPIEIHLAPTSNLFAAGHRIRLDISSSNFPRFDRNPNTGEPMGRHTFEQIAYNRVFFDRERPSHIVLPVVPA